MFIQPWDASLDDAEWQAWIADGHDFGQLAVNGPPGQAPVVVPTHFTVDGTGLLVHLARPNPVWKAIEHAPDVTFTVIGDYAFVPGTWRTAPDVPPEDGVPTSYYAAVQFVCRARVIDDPEAKADLLTRQLAHFQPDGDHAEVAPGSRRTAGCCPASGDCGWRWPRSGPSSSTTTTRASSTAAPSRTASPTGARDSTSPPRPSSAAAPAASAPGRPERPSDKGPFAGRQGTFVPPRRTDRRRRLGACAEHR
ncbi:FMN-binding negative transcriptional regulator [Spirillospora sp. NPDC049652]